MGFGSSNAVTDGSVTTSKLAAGAVTPPKLNASLNNQIAELMVGNVFVESTAGINYSAAQPEFFSDADGKRNTVDTANTDTIFSGTSHTAHFAATAPETLGETLGSNTVDAGAAGEQITTTSACNPIVSVTKKSTCTATRCRITASNKTTVLGTATFSGDVATFSPHVALAASTVYYILLDNSGSNYSRAYNTGVSYPKTGGAVFNFTDHSSTGSGYADGIVSVTTEATAAATSRHIQTIALTAMDGSYSRLRLHPYLLALATGNTCTWAIDYTGDGTWQKTGQAVDSWVDLGGAQTLTGAKMKITLSQGTGSDADTPSCKGYGLVGD
ncbi:MAG: hypothetical protein PHV13_02930 [Candidatus ainarchaeum sp.]|nr:hypothetical protein [Candidatus ainarchaeum sp.]